MCAITLLDYTYPNLHDVWQNVLTEFVFAVQIEYHTRAWLSVVHYELRLRCLFYNHRDSLSTRYNFPFRPIRMVKSGCEIVSPNPLKISLWVWNTMSRTAWIVRRRILPHDVIDVCMTGNLDRMAVIRAEGDLTHCAMCRSSSAILRRYWFVGVAHKWFGMCRGCHVNVDDHEHVLWNNKLIPIEKRKPCWLESTLYVRRECA
jgi:hypothetical protein